MFDFMNPENINKDYKGFVLLSIDDLTDYNAKGLYLRHKKTGLEIYHIVKDDKENLFAFAFRTISKDSKGAAHIMEHSTLCGSEKYPLKEPFATLASQSLNTFLNALTYPDKTVYPGASLVKQDYFNMMDVYADSVFFPKLDYTTFIQEGHRLEMDEKGNLSIQGVVYNEMKGEYSSFNQLAYDGLVSSMFPDSYPAFDSGGDPLDIPKLTYKEFLDFHQKFYNPDNCLLFLYGDIPTEEQIDYLDEHFMPRIEKKYNCSIVNNFDSKLPLIKDEIQKLKKLNLNQESKEVRIDCPETGATGNFVTMNWYSGNANIEKRFLGEVLHGNDSSPISKALKESKLGDDELSGNFGQFSEEFYSLGLSGVKPKDEKKVFKLVDEVIHNVYENGVSQQDIDSAIMGIDFALREINRYYGPFSITLMGMVLKAWTNGFKCSQFLYPISDFEELKKKIYSDKDFVKKLIKKYFIDSNVIVKYIAQPSSDYVPNRDKAEAKLISDFSKNLDKQKLREDLDKLHAYQQKIETPEETSCIPHTKISELPPDNDNPIVSFDLLEGSNNTKIPFFISEEDTNGIFYLEVLFPFDNLSPDYYKYIPLLTDIITNLGWNGKSWDQCISESACVMGDVWGRILEGNRLDTEESKKQFEKYKEYNFSERKWIGLCCKALTEKSEECLDLLAELIAHMDFKDVDRFSSLIQESVADKKASVIQYGREIASKRARATVTKGTALSEIMYGLTQLYAFAEFEKTDHKKLLEKLAFVYSECLKAGGILHITADKKSLEKIIPQLNSFAQKAEIKPLSPVCEYPMEEYLKNIVHVENISDNHFTELIQAKSQVGYATMVIPSAKAVTKEASAELVYCSWLDMHTLWDKIRTTGGAYGVSSNPNNLDEIMTISSYRDPFPYKSLDAFIESLEEASKINYPEEEIERTIVNVYGNAIIPLAPKDRGRYSFESFIYNTYGIKKLKVKMLLEVTKEDVTKVSKNYSAKSKDMCRKVIFGNKPKNFSGKIIKLPL